MTFTKETVKFFRALAKNNDREWFQPRKEEYERVALAPMLELVDEINRKLARAAPHFITDPKKAVYRIYRDVRFSKNKAPYKTNVAAVFWDQALGKNGGCGLYMQFSPEDFLVASGAYMMPPPEVLLLRRHIAENHARLKKILAAKKIKELYGGEMQGDKAVRPPKGFAADHPAIEWIKQKDFLLERTMPPESAMGDGAVALVAEHLLAMVPFVEFLNEAFKARARKRDPLLGV